VSTTVWKSNNLPYNLPNAEKQGGVFQKLFLIIPADITALYGSIQYSIPYFSRPTDIWN